MVNNVRESIGDETSGDLAIKVTADVGEALTGFKALQRELRETTKELRELERAHKDVEEALNMPKAITSLSEIAISCGVELPNSIESSTKDGEITTYDLSEVSTKDLTEELAKREGVTEYYVGPHGEHAIIKFYDEDGAASSVDVSGARILVNID